MPQKMRPGWRPRFSLQSLLIATFFLLSATTLWLQRKPWILETAYPACDRRSVIYALAFTLDSRHLLTGSSHPNASAKAWNLLTGEREFELVGHADDIGELKYSADNTRILSASADGTAKIWSAIDGSLLGVLPHEQDATDPNIRGVHSITMSPDGKYIATAEDGNLNVFIWDAHTYHLIRTLRGKARVIAADFFADSLRLIACYEGGAGNGLGIGIFNVESGKEIKMLSGQSDGVINVCVTANDRVAFTFGQQGIIQKWDLETAQCLYTANHGDDIYTSAMSSDETLIATGGGHNNCKVCIWRAQTGEKLFEFDRFKFVSDLSFSSDGRRLLVVSLNAVAKVFDPSSGKELTQLNTRNANCGRFSPDGNRIVIGCDNGTVQIWRLVHPEPWYGISWLPSFWTTIAMAIVITLKLKTRFYGLRVRT